MTATNHAADSGKGFRTKAQAAVDSLTERIRSGEIAPGERIDVEALSESLGMSATPVREALRQLEAEGLVSNTPHRGVRVSEVTPLEASALYDLRVQLECYALRVSLPRLTGEEIEKLEELTVLHQLAVERDDRISYDRYNREWHELTYSRANTPYLHEFINRLWNAFPWTTSWQGPERLSGSVEGHARMLSLIKSGQFEAAEAFLHIHILEGKAFVLKRLESDADDPAQPAAAAKKKRIARRRSAVDSESK